MIYLSFLGISSPKLPTSNWMRIAFWSISFLGYIIFTMYQNYIGAFLAIPQFRPPISGIEELLDSSYKISVSKGSSVEKYFTQAENGSIYNQILKNGKINLHKKDIFAIENMKKGIQIQNYFAVTLNLLQNSSQKFYTILDKSPNFLVFGVYQPIKSLPEYPCKIMSVPRDYRKTGNGFVYQKNWPYTNLMNFQMIKVK